MEERKYYSLEDLEKFKVEVEGIIEPDLLQEEREQHKLHLHQANRQRLPKTPAKGQALDLEQNQKPPEHQARLPLRATTSNEGEGLGGGVRIHPHIGRTHIHE